MSLALIDSVSSLLASRSLNNASTALNTFLQDLSSAPAHDSEAGSVISQPVNRVQTGEGALHEALPNQSSGLAVDGSDDPDGSPAVLADETEMATAIYTIKDIMQTTKTGGTKMFSGTPTPGSFSTAQTIAAYSEQLENALDGFQADTLQANASSLSMTL